MRKRLLCKTGKLFRSGNLRQFLLTSNHGKTQKLDFKPWLDRRTPCPFGNKFRFTQLNPFCLVLPWIDAKRKLLKFPLLRVCILYNITFMYFINILPYLGIKFTIFQRGWRYCYPVYNIFDVFKNSFPES